MKESDIAVLEKQTDEVLAEGWCLLNRWGWPEWLPDPMTEAERNTKDYTPDNRASEIMRWIDDKLGHKVVNRCWNKDCMTDEEHEDFWNGYHEGDEEARKRDEARSMARVKREIEEFGH